MRALPMGLLAAATLFAMQDPVAVNPRIVHVEFENDSIRVLRVHYEPHDSLGMHSHPPRLVVNLRNSHSRATLPDGTSTETHGTVGRVVWREPETHSVENIGDVPLENIEVEFKKASAPATPVSSSQAAAASPNPTEPVPVEQESHHHVVLENQYVRVLDVSIPPGETTLLHTHSHDNLAVRLNGGSVETQEMGKGWQSATLTPGTIIFRNALTHRVKNVGNQVYHVVDLEILQ
jgi:quercetin dioxygenase-like cupin family protein